MRERSTIKAQEKKIPERVREIKTNPGETKLGGRLARGGV